MEKAIYYEDYEIGSVRETTGRTITETDIVLHAGQTGDFFPHHMDAEWCKTTDFGQRIAHGTLIFSVGVGMTATLINPAAFSYGYDSPKHPDKGFVVENVQVYNQKEELCLVADHLMLCDKKEFHGTEA